MKRARTPFLMDWLKSSARKPLVVRGARQVGKTWMVRDFARSAGLQLIELNLEKRPELESLFSSNDPSETLVHLQALWGNEIKPQGSLLFLDEIQAAPHLLAKLRWFAEDMPELPLIAAGSLLEFTLADHKFSIPVGRISYMNLEPLSFEEFLDAIGQEGLKGYIENFEWPHPIPRAIHESLMSAIKEYLIIGGMPAAVAIWAEHRAPAKVSQIHFDLLATYRDDFAKYRGRLSLDRLQEVLASVPQQLGRKFVYSRVNDAISSAPIKQALELLSMAQVCHRILATSGNGLPLGAEVHEKYMKVIMLDCGLCGASLGLNLHQLHQVEEISLINSGGMAEQLAGQLLRPLPPPYVTPSLYYWQRWKASAEVDYLFQHENTVVPLEVKAGKSGRLKSLHQFMKEKGHGVAVRLNSQPPERGTVANYTLCSLPFYLTGQLHRLL